MEIYASERCKASASITRKVDVFHQRCLQRIMKIWYFDHVTNEMVLRQSNLPRLSVTIAHYHLKLAGHIIHMNNSHNPKKYSGARPSLTTSKASVGMKPKSSLEIAIDEETLSPNKLNSMGGKEKDVVLEVCSNGIKILSFTYLH